MPSDASTNTSTLLSVDPMRIAEPVVLALS